MSKEKKSKISKAQKMKISIIFLSVAVVLLAVLVVTVSFKNRAVQTVSGNVSNSLNGAQGEISSYKDIISQKDSEIESFSQAADEQNSVYSSEKDELNNKISELNKQIALKKQQQAAAKPNAPSVTEPVAPPSGGSTKTIYLTFDDGPSPNTPKILSILNEYGVKATFFVINTKYNSYMKDIVNSGNAIALHSYTHDYSNIYSSEEAYFNDLNAISDVVYNETGIRSNIMRFPGGSSNTVSRKYNSGIMSRLSSSVKEQGYQYYDWNCSSGDASGNNVPAATIISNCKKLPSSNTVIVLMHDTGAKGTTVEALPQVIEYYQSIGCNFAVIDSSTYPVHQHINN